MLGTKLLFIVVFLSLLLPVRPSEATECAIEEQACVLQTIEEEAAKIENTSWRDQTYRELAKTKAGEEDFDGAITLIDKIETPDTQAMTIRGIGMAAADLKLPQEQYDALFIKLRAKADIITHPPSYAIALTYIAMAQAFAGDNEGAWRTASEMENDALRHKAYGETAEIQAQAGDFEAAMASITFIDSMAFRNKAYSIVSRLLAYRRQFDDAFKAAAKITNPYKKSAALQVALDIKKQLDVDYGVSSCATAVPEAKTDEAAKIETPAPPSTTE